MLPISVRGMAQPGSIRDLWSPIGLVCFKLGQRLLLILMLKFDNDANF